MIKTQIKRPICLLCGIRPARKAGTSTNGYQLWRKHCASCDSAAHRRPRVVDLQCTQCGWVAADICQIDTIDGQSVCSNCSRLRTKRLAEQRRQQYEIKVDATVNIWDIRL